MAAVIDDELLDHFCISGDWAEYRRRDRRALRRTADRVVSYFAGMAWQRDPAALGPWGEVARDVYRTDELIASVPRPSHAIRSSRCDTERAPHRRQLEVAGRSTTSARGRRARPPGGGAVGSFILR